MIEREDVRKLASLARIKIDESEEEKIAQDMEGVLAYIGQLDEVNVSSTASKEGEIRNIMREDVDVDEAGKFTNSIMEDAPESENGFLVVKKIL